jgi:HlyD family secretion protein
MREVCRGARLRRRQCAAAASARSAAVCWRTAASINATFSA